MKNMKKILVLLVAAVLLVAVSVAGTVAYLTAQTGEITNTFTPATLSVNLNESKPANKIAQMVPGATIEKDPKVTYTTDVPAYVFVKVTEQIGSNLSFDAYIDYSVITGTGAWTALDGFDGVYYMAVEKDGCPEGGISIIQDASNPPVADKVTVKNIGLAEMQALVNDSDANDMSKYPKLSFQAYIIQQLGFEDNPAGAWAELNPQTSGD